MNVTQAFIGTRSALDIPTPEAFEADAVTPFPLEGVYMRLYIRAVMSDDIAHDADALELAVLFQNTFGEGISLSRVREAQARADDRMASEEDRSRRTILVEEVVEAYGRDYAFTSSSFRRQYDAVKWATVVGLDRIGEAAIRAGDAAVEKARSWRAAWQARRSSGEDEDEDNVGTGTRIFAPLRKRVTKIRE